MHRARRASEHQRSEDVATLSPMPPHRTDQTRPGRSRMCGLYLGKWCPTQSSGRIDITMIIGVVPRIAGSPEEAAPHQSTKAMRDRCASATHLSSSHVGGAHLPVDQRCCCVEQPSQRCDRLGLGQLVAEFTSGVGHRTLQHVQVVVQRIEFRARHDQLLITQRQLTRTLPRHPVPLPAGLRTELTRSPRPGVLGQGKATPPTPPTSPFDQRSNGPLCFLSGHFRHDEIVDGGSSSDVGTPEDASGRGQAGVERLADVRDVATLRIGSKRPHHLARSPPPSSPGSPPGSSDRRPPLSAPDSRTSASIRTRRAPPPRLRRPPRTPATDDLRWAHTLVRSCHPFWSSTSPGTITSNRNRLRFPHCTWPSGPRRAARHCDMVAAVAS